MSEAAAEIEKAIEVTEFACSMPQLASGEILEVSRGVECRVDRYPLGVVASIDRKSTRLNSSHGYISYAVFCLKKKKKKTNKIRYTTRDTHENRTMYTDVTTVCR